VKALRGLALTLVLAATASPAFADERVRDPEDTWKSIARDPETEVADREYHRAMLEGDNNLDFAVAEVQVASRRKKYVEDAVNAYEAAARARPTSPEPHFRAAAALHRFYIDCNPHEGAALCRAGTHTATFRKNAERVIKHWEAFEANAPTDPRLAEEILFERAITHTKLETPEHLAQARADYLKILALRHVGSRDSIVMGNLAETDMMLGDLDAAIVHYRRTLEIDQRVSHYFGLAVALDRDEQGSLARSLLRTFGTGGVKEMERAIMTHEVFYVPDGEAYYYLALGYEAIGLDDAAITYYDEFLKRGAHPQFAPRARANRAALAERRQKRASDDRRSP
jgi:tetratricopeptide (TPR) repeat protein